jgi:hypothetical protein
MNSTCAPTSVADELAQLGSESLESDAHNDGARICPETDIDRLLLAHRNPIGPSVAEWVCFVQLNPP